MKNIFQTALPALFVLISVLAFSCGKDNDPDTTNPLGDKTTNIVGIYKGTYGHNIDGFIYTDNETVATVAKATDSTVTIKFAFTQQVNTPNSANTLVAKVSNDSIFGFQNASFIGTGKFTGVGRIGTLQGKKQFKLEMPSETTPGEAAGFLGFKQ